MWPIRICVASLFTWMIAASLLYCQSQATSEFAAEVRSGFARWDQDKDGQLTKLEVDAQIADARITGKQAAALAAIATFQNGAGKKRPLSCEFLLREAAESSKEVNPSFELRYRDAMSRIENVSRVLYGPGAPGLQEVRQGHIGDCFFVAIVGAVAERNPKDVRRWIEEQPDRTFKVQFPLGAQSVVKTPTDGEIALTSFAGKQGLWINYLERAFGSIMESAFPNAGDGDALDAIAFGGTPLQTMRMMTANDPVLVPIRTDDRSPPNAEQVQLLVPKLRTNLVECQTNKRIACAGSPRGVMPPGMTPQHAYAVLGFDQARDAVRLWNPHGNHFEPKGQAGLDNGYKVQHGRFEIPLGDFVKVFSFMAYESGVSLRQ